MLTAGPGVIPPAGYPGAAAPGYAAPAGYQNGPYGQPAGAPPMPGYQGYSM